MEGPKSPKRRMMDKSIPTSLLSDPAFAADSRMYQDLLDMERRLDWQMMRKKVEVQDALGRPATTTRTLRLFLSHTSYNQPWQTGTGADAPTMNVETGEGVPGWQFKLEGRLLELPNQRAKDRPANPRKLSTFIKRMIIELDRDHALYPDGNMAEFHRSPTTPVLDGFTLRRTGDTPVRLKIMIDLEQQPEVYKVTGELGHLLGIREETRTGVVQALWNYIKLNQLQDKMERQLVRADAALKPIFGAEAIPFRALPEVAMRYLAPPDPVVLHYTVDPSQASPDRPQAWDVEIRTDDTQLKAKLGAAALALTGTGASQLATLDSQLAAHAQSAHNSAQKRAFLRAFSADPAGFVQTWLASQARDLDAVLGTSEAAILGPAGGLGGGAIGAAAESGEGTAEGEFAAAGRRVRAEELRRSEFFALPWVEEAVAVQEGMRLAQKTVG